MAQCVPPLSIPRLNSRRLVKEPSIRNVCPGPAATSGPWSVETLRICLAKIVCVVFDVVSATRPHDVAEAEVIRHRAVQAAGACLKVRRRIAVKRPDVQIWAGDREPRNAPNGEAGVRAADDARRIRRAARVAVDAPFPPGRNAA